MNSVASILKVIGVLWILFLIFIGWESVIMPTIKWITSNLSGVIKNILSGKVGILYFFLLLIPGIGLLIFAKRLRGKDEEDDF